MPINLNDIAELATVTEERANRLLKQGWVLLAVNSTQAQPVFTLGRPEPFETSDDYAKANFDKAGLAPAFSLEASCLADIATQCSVPTDFGQFVDGQNGYRLGTNIATFEQWRDFFRTILSAHAAKYIESYTSEKALSRNPSV